MPIVVKRCLGLSEKLHKYGPTREVEVISGSAFTLPQFLLTSLTAEFPPHSAASCHVLQSAAAWWPPFRWCAKFTLILVPVMLACLTSGFQCLVFCNGTQVQDAMARITLDVIMATGFDLPSDAVDLDKPCPLLDDMHFLMAETFR